MMRVTVAAVVFSVAVAFGTSARLLAQGTTAARLIVTVTDPTGGVLPNAIVTVKALEPAANADPIPVVTATAQGVATLANLPPGRYSIQAEFDGFETRVLPDVRLRTGDNRQTVVLALQRLQDAVTVAVNPQVAAADRGRTFGTALTREQIDALSDDPDEMRRQIEEMAGIGAVIRVDSFEGSALPPKSQIKSIHITRDAFAAENHFAGGLFVDIITQPGVGPLRGGMNMRLRDGSMSGKSPFVDNKGPEQTQNYFANLGGSLAKERSSFSVSMSGTHSYDTAIVNAALPNGTVAQNVPRTTPRDNMFLSGLVDYALNKDQTLRIGYNQSWSKSRNLGVGSYDLPERAYGRDDSSYSIRVQEAGPLGRRFFMNSRMSFSVNDGNAQSALEAPTIVVNDAFTRGGQQLAGGRNSRTFNLASDLDYVRGRHSWRTGVQLDGGWYKSDEFSNYFGTFTFASLEAFEAGIPSNYTRRVGDPNIEYFHMTGGWYLQDDIRVRNNLTLSPGVRIEALTHVNDFSNIGPRFGFTWAPFRSGRTTLRASAGIFYEWMSPFTYEQTLRVDGFRQQEVSLVDPPFHLGVETPIEGGTTSGVNRYLLGNDLELATFKRVSAGIDQTLTRSIRVGVNYAYTRGSDLWHGNNLNMPVDGVRPDPLFANVVEVTSDGRSSQHSVSTNFSVNFARPTGGAPVPPAAVGDRIMIAPPPARAAAQRLDWRRVSVNGNFTLGRNLTNSAEGAFGLSPTGNIENDWGPAGADVRRRLNFGVNSTQLRNFNANLNFNLASGSPYNVRTGRDNNGDLVFNDRPIGVSRNSERGGGQFTVNGNFSYTIAFGRGVTSAPPGIQIAGGPGGPTAVVAVASPQAAARYRLQFIVSVLNLTNHYNYSGYSGTVTSPFFGNPTSVTNPRKVDVGMSFNF